MCVVSRRTPKERPDAGLRNFTEASRSNSLASWVFLGCHPFHPISNLLSLFLPNIPPSKMSPLKILKLITCILWLSKYSQIKPGFKVALLMFQNRQLHVDTLKALPCDSDQRVGFCILWPLFWEKKKLVVWYSVFHHTRLQHVLKDLLSGCPILTGSLSIVNMTWLTKSLSSVRSG